MMPVPSSPLPLAVVTWMSTTLGMTEEETWVTLPGVLSAVLLVFSGERVLDAAVEEELLLSLAA